MLHYALMKSSGGVHYQLFDKNEAGQSKMLREVDEQCAKEGISYSEKLKKFC